MNQFLLENWKVTCELAPWLLLGMLLSGLMHALLPPDFIRQKFQGFGGVIKAVLLGIPLPLCSCGVIPAGIGLKNQGASNGAAIGFLISTPQTGVDSILVSAAFFGWPFAIFKMVSAAVLGLVGGWLAEWIEPESSNQAPTIPSAPPSSTASAQHDSGPKPTGLGSLPVLTSVPVMKPSTQDLPDLSLGSRIRDTIQDLIQHAIGVLRSIWIWLLVGVLISSAIETLIPQDWLAVVSQAGLGLSMLLVLIISVPLYVCATASVPIAASIVHGGFPPAAALVFLIAGPATNVSTIGAIYGRFGVRTLLVYLLTIVLGSMSLSVLFHWTLTAKIAPSHAHHDHGATWWGVLSAVVILALMSFFAWQSVSQSFSRLRSGR